jgi:hypothetical protein
MVAYEKESPKWVSIAVKLLIFSEGNWFESELAQQPS